jgi:hypothetical protein
MWIKGAENQAGTISFLEQHQTLAKKPSLSFNRGAVTVPKSQTGRQNLLVKTAGSVAP